jgi:phage gp45-like
MMSIIRGLVKAVRAAKKTANPMRFDASGREGEEFDDREMFQQYGFASRPPKDTQCLLLRTGQNVYMVASDGTEYKAKLEDGEVAISDKYDNVIHLKKGGEILIQGGKVNVDSGDINLGPIAQAALLSGVVTVTCLCSITGAPHPMGSTQVKAVL